MRAKDIRQGIAVWATRSGSTRPAIIAHGPERGRWWVSYTDRLMPPSAGLRPRDLERRQQ